MSYIKLHRDILDSYCFANPNHLKIWIWLLTKANFKKTYVPYSSGGGITTIELQRGQMIFGRFTAEEQLDMNGSMIYRTLKKFEELEQIKIEANNKFSIITICNYDSYQDNNCEDEQQANNRRTTDEQLVNTLQEGKEGKEGKEYNISINSNLKNSNLFRQPNIPTLEDVKFAFVQNGGSKEMAEKFFNKYSSTDWFINNSPITNFKALIPNFISNYKSNEQQHSKSNSKAGKKLTSDERFEIYRTWADQFSDDSPQSNGQ